MGKLGGHCVPGSLRGLQARISDGGGEGVAKRRDLNRGPEGLNCSGSDLNRPSVSIHQWFSPKRTYPAEFALTGTTQEETFTFAANPVGTGHEQYLRQRARRLSEYFTVAMTW
jgi:hypothetical protein